MIVGTRVVRHDVETIEEISALRAAEPTRARDRHVEHRLRVGGAPAVTIQLKINFAINFLCSNVHMFRFGLMFRSTRDSIHYPFEHARAFFTFFRPP